MKVLIIGSKGFIGRYLYQYLVDNHVDCWGSDVFSDYTEDKFYLLDTTNSDFNDLFSKNKFDYCINCSGAASVPDSLMNPFRDYTLNTFNVFKMLDAIRRFNPDCKFINLSSAAVYGNPVRLPISEEDQLSPMSPYGLHKLQAESICKEFFRFYSIKCCSLRIFSAYGGGLRKQLLWDLFLKSKNTNHITLWGTGKETRDFIHISDIVKAIWHIIRYGSFNADIYNIASGHEVMIDQVTDIFYKYLGRDIQFKFNGEVRYGDPQHWVADIKKIKDLGFYPKISLSEGIKNYISWLQEEGLV
jgi:UDP-glucose 4-epimerase